MYLVQIWINKSFKSHVVIISFTLSSLLLISLHLMMLPIDQRERRKEPNEEITTKFINPEKLHKTFDYLNEIENYTSLTGFLLLDLAFPKPTWLQENAIQPDE